MTFDAIGEVEKPESNIDSCVYLYEDARRILTGRQTGYRTETGKYAQLPSPKRPRKYYPRTEALMIAYFGGEAKQRWK